MRGADTDTTGGRRRPVDGATGLLCALPEELGRFAVAGGAAPPPRVVAGLEVWERELHGGPLLAVVGGVGKVAAARAATALVTLGVRRLLVVGVCGALRRGLPVGTLVHCRETFQVDLGVRAGRQHAADPELVAAWRAAAAGAEGWFLTADQAVLTRRRRRQLARAFAGPAVADMETAAAAAVAAGAGVPWAALRAVTDLAGPGTAAALPVHYPAQAGRAADTVAALLARLDG